MHLTIYFIAQVSVPHVNLVTFSQATLVKPVQQAVAPALRNFYIYLKKNKLVKKFAISAKKANIICKINLKDHLPLHVQSHYLDTILPLRQLQLVKMDAFVQGFYWIIYY
jgi:hypothetical protein